MIFFSRRSGFAVVDGKRVRVSVLRVYATCGDGKKTPVWFQIKASQSGSRATRLLFPSGGQEQTRKCANCERQQRNCFVPWCNQTRRSEGAVAVRAGRTGSLAPCDMKVNFSETLVGQWRAGVDVAASRFAAPAVPTAWW
jgi:hypothetical protein